MSMMLSKQDWIQLQEHWSIVAKHVSQSENSTLNDAANAISEIIKNNPNNVDVEIITKSISNQEFDNIMNEIDNDNFKNDEKINNENNNLSHLSDNLKSFIMKPVCYVTLSPMVVVCIV